MTRNDLARVRNKAKSFVLKRTATTMLWGLVAAALLTGSQTARAEPVINFNLSSGPLKARLFEFADTAHVLLYALYPSYIKDRLPNTHAVVGPHHPTAAMLLMLRGTDFGVTYRRDTRLYNLSGYFSSSPHPRVPMQSE
jgi:hypothetical protein